MATSNALVTFTPNRPTKKVFAHKLKKGKIITKKVKLAESSAELTIDAFNHKTSCATLKHINTGKFHMFVDVFQKLCGFKSEKSAQNISIKKKIS